MPLSAGISIRCVKDLGCDLQSWFPDNDGDGLGEPNNEVQVAPAPTGMSTTPTTSASTSTPSISMTLPMSPASTSTAVPQVSRGTAMSMAWSPSAEGVGSTKTSERPPMPTETRFHRPAKTPSRIQALKSTPTGTATRIWMNMVACTMGLPSWMTGTCVQPDGKCPAMRISSSSSMSWVLLGKI